MKPISYQVFKNEFKGESVEEGIAFLDVYFSEVVFDIEKDEWTRMNDEEKKNLVRVYMK